MEIENVLIRLREATTEINRATDDPRMKATIEKSWLLQDRLMFPDMVGYVKPTPQTVLTISSPVLGQRLPFVRLVTFISAVFFTSHGKPQLGLMAST